MLIIIGSTFWIHLGLTTRSAQLMIVERSRHSGTNLDRNIASSISQTVTNRTPKLLIFNSARRKKWSIGTSSDARGGALIILSTTTSQTGAMIQSARSG